MKVTRKNPAQIPPVTLSFIFASIMSREFVAARKPPRLLERIAWSRVQPWIHGNFVDEWNGNYFWKSWKSTKSRGKRSCCFDVFWYFGRGEIKQVFQRADQRYFILPILSRGGKVGLWKISRTLLLTCTFYYYISILFYFVLSLPCFALIAQYIFPLNDSERST